MAQQGKYQDNAGQQSMDNLFSALGSIQQNTQADKEQQLRKFLQQQQLGSEAALQKERLTAEGERQQAGFGHDKEMVPINEASAEQLATKNSNLGVSADKQKQQNTVDQATKLQTQYPNAKVNVGNVGIDTITPAEKTSNESKEIYGEFDRRTKADQDALRATGVIEQNLANPNAMDPGLLQSEMAKLSVQGRIPQQEYDRIFPSTIKQAAAKAYNYVGPLAHMITGGKLPDVAPPNQQSISDSQRAYIANTVKNVKTAARQNIEKTRAELQQAGTKMAPTMQRQGDLQNFVGNLGSQYNAPQAPQQPPAAPGPQQVAPPPQGGGKIRVKHKQSGQTGTIDSGNPQDMADLKSGVYEQVQ